MKTLHERMLENLIYIRENMDKPISVGEFEKWLRIVCFQKPTNESYDLAKCAWMHAYQAGKTRARYEVLAVIVALYFIVALIGKLASA